MKTKTLLLAVTALIVSLACTITLFDTPPSPTPVASFTPVASSTQAIILPADTETLPPPPITEPPQPTYTPLPTFTPYPTIPPPTSAPQFAVSATLIKNANCRQGPSQAYEVVTSFFAGQVLEIVGRNPDFSNTWWQVVIPGTHSTCWISLTTAQATGNFDDLPIIYPPY
jgi:uncharacterized protein YgiM (DUF1202 family)